MTVKRIVQLKLVGCDDVTKIVCQLSPEELELVERLAKRFNAESVSNCQPRLKIEEPEETEIEEL